MTKQFREREKMMFTEMERRLQREVDKLKARIMLHSLMHRMLKSTPQTDKDSELANMEQRFARRHRFQDQDMEMDTSPSRKREAGQPSTPSAKPLSGTPCLDAIKMIKRSRGISRKTRLVSVAVDVDAEEVPQEQLSEQDVPPHQQHNTPPMTSMEDAVARGVEAALRRVFIDKEFPVVNKRSPRRRKRSKKKSGEKKPPKQATKETFFWENPEPASHQDVYAYEYEDGPGPDPRNPTFDLQNGYKSPWNSRIIDSLLEELQKRGGDESWPFRRSEMYFRDILQHRFKRLRTIWTAAQPKVTAKGALETPAEVEERLIAKKDETLKSTRQTTRRKNKYLRRATVLDHLVKQISDETEKTSQPGSGFSN
ncbi:hypothetical protein BDR07DRAFT_1486450 [Suillus spraguei]|nr:hypothetical protein BDR07DRAFT_1486450 [Suillus spraguei]